MPDNTYDHGLYDTAIYDSSGVVTPDPDIFVLGGQYRVVVADRAGTELDEVPAKNLQYSFTLDDAGTCYFQLPLLDASCKRSLLDPGKREIHVYRGDTLVWGGDLWAAQVSELSQGQVVQFSAAEYYERLRHRIIDVTKDYKGWGQVDIAWDLIAFTQAKTGGNMNITRGTTPATGIVRDVRYPAFDRTTVADAIDAIVRLNDGFDFKITPDKTFKTFYPSKGSLKDSIVFEVGKNVSSISYTIDAADIANKIDAVGGGSGQDACYASAIDTTSRGDYGLMELAFQFSDIRSFALLQKRADNRLRLYKKPRYQPEFGVWLQAKDPDYGSFLEGDTVRVRGNYGYVSLDQNFRIVGLEYHQDNDGREAASVFLDDTIAR
jgi:hypothetical protein